MRPRSRCFVYGADHRRPIVVLRCQVSRKNLRLRVGDAVTVALLPDAALGTVVVVRPVPDSDGGTGSVLPPNTLLQEYLVPYFRDAYRPVTTGDCFVVQHWHATRSDPRADPGDCFVVQHWYERDPLADAVCVEFCVVDAQPGGQCHVAPTTTVVCAPL